MSAPAAGTLSQRILHAKPVSPFVAASCRRGELWLAVQQDLPGTTRSRQTSRPLPCSPLAGPWGPLLLRPLSPTTALHDEGAVRPLATLVTRPTQPGTGYHTGRRSGSRVSLDLYPIVHVASGRYPTDPLLCVSRLPARHRFRQEQTRPGDFGGQNTEAPPLPVSSRHSPFGTVSDRTHLQGLSPRSWLSFSPRAVWAPRRAWS